MVEIIEVSIIWMIILKVRDIKQMIKKEKTF